MMITVFGYPLSRHERRRQELERAVDRRLRSDSLKRQKRQLQKLIRAQESRNA